MAQDVIINTVEYEGIDQVVLPTREGGEANFIEAGIIPHPSDANPLMDGSASAGSSNDYSRADHVHPSDSTKADASNVYTKTEVDTLVSGKADASNVYTKTEMDTALSGKADSSSVYTKTETDTLLSGKANASDVEELEEEMTDYRQMYLDSLIHTTASGSIASFSDGFKDAPMDSCTATIEPKQEGSGDPSPTNVRPISGWTGAEVVRCGKNLFPMTAYEGVAYNPADGAVFNTTPKPIQPTDNGDGTFTITFTSTWKYYCFVMPLVNGQTYAYKIQYASTGQAGSTIGYLGKDMKVLTKVNATDASKTLTATATGTDERKYLYLCISNRATATATITITNPQVELGSTATAYAPYTSDTYSVTWESEAGTVYGGSVDLVSGVLTATHTIVDLGTLNWVFRTEYTDRSQFETQLLDGTRGSTDMICSMFATYTGTRATAPNLTIFKGNQTDSRTLMIRDDSYTDATAFKQMLADNNAQFVYELATPTTYQLTPQEITTLLGSNNVWADTGAMACGYVADTKLYIDSKL